ncbi:PREDICTED: DNA polymerase zeta catalytic subunit-like [Acropora digitifera]|uniref:DNA polymerase zeta catalytic subunit-like n=1 Tax=Acropora digitifera TaxID=70779 RepID=UPI00077ADD8D|nr:PREDICTED: DNA polymerase zeta catalytic subunit-like [Acropora digitifera]
MFSVRIVNSDFYTAAPIENLDVCKSQFRECTIDKVPVIRVYGATPAGQKTCVHVHGVFPYIYVPYDGTEPTDKYLKQFAVSVDFALQVALGKASSSRQHVYRISVVKGIPFYGYHEGEKEFLRISFYNPFLVTRVVNLLQNGAVMNKVFQPHEAHIPYLLQFFMDHNLYGMNLLHASAVKFRKPVRHEINGNGCAATQASNSPELSVKTLAFASHQIWNEDTVPRECVLGPDVERLSSCELEVDVVASDILNKLEIGANIGSNPGLAAIWEDEQQRRREANESSQISAPSSQDRGLIQLTETEKQLQERIKEIIEERDLLIQSQIEKLGRNSLSPQELAAFQDSICSFALSQGQAIADESLDEQSLSQLLSQHEQGLSPEGSLAKSSQMIINEDEPVVNQSLVEASQKSFSQELSSSMDKEMVNILASLADDEPASQRVALSQSIVLDEGDVPDDEEANEENELSEGEESILMSQRVWDDVEHESPGSTDAQRAEEQDAHAASQRTITGKGGFSESMACSHEGRKDDTESPNDKVWPRKGRAIRTYSKHSLSAMRKEKSLQKATETQNDEKAQSGVYAKRDDDEGDEEAVFRLFLSESSDSDGSNLDEVRESFDSREVNEIPSKMLKDKNNDRRTENFASLEDKTSVERKLRSDRKDWHEQLEHKKEVCFEVNDGKKDETLEGDLTSRKMNIVASEESNGSGVKKGVRERPYSAKKEQNTSQSCVPVITKYFNSPDKSSKDAETGDVVELTSQILPHCSKDKETDVGTFTIRKRKLTVTDKKNPKRSEKQRADVGAALDVVRGAMSNLKVLLEDVAQTPAMDIKFNEARTRLRNKREPSVQNFTRVIEKQSSSPVRTETLSQKPLSVRSRRLEKSPSSKNVSPKRKEERMKKYGELPVLIVKSPRKTDSFSNSRSSENATGIPLNQGDLSVPRLTSNVNSTGGRDSDHEPSAGETCTQSSPLTTKGSLTICKSYKSSEFSLRDDSIRDKVAYLCNDLKCTLKQNFPEEKGSELLANALFNMSFPSPLPCEEECNSPPDPSTPLGTACDGNGVEDQRPKTLDENSSRFVDKNSFQCLETTERKSPISFSDKQATRPSCTYISFSNNSMPPEVSSLGTCCPQLGETQSQLETMDDETEEQSNLQHGQSKSCDTERITRLVTHEEIVASKRNIDEENRYLTPNTELAILENDPCESRAVCEGKRSESTNVATAHFSQSTTTKSHSLRTELDSTDCDEAVEMSSGDIESKDFLLRLTSVDNSGEALDKSDVSKIDRSLNKDGDIQLCNAFTENKNLSITQPSESGKSDKGKQISSPRNVFIEGVVTDTAEGLVVEPADQSGERKAISKVPNTAHNQSNFTTSSNDGTSGIVAIKPLKQPPNADELIASLKEYGLPHCKYQAPFCSNPDDIPACPREVGGRFFQAFIYILLIQLNNEILATQRGTVLVIGLCSASGMVEPATSRINAQRSEFLQRLWLHGAQKSPISDCHPVNRFPLLHYSLMSSCIYLFLPQVSSLPEFESSNSSQGLTHWRMVLSSARECGIQTNYHAMYDTSKVSENIDLKIALMGHGDVVLTPSRGPPTAQAVKAWARRKLSKLNSRETANEEDCAPKKVTDVQGFSKYENDPEKEKVNTNVAKTGAMESEKVIPVTSDSKAPLTQGIREDSISPVDATQEMFADNKREKAEDAMILSDSSKSAGELTSPNNLFSPNEDKIFSYAAGKGKEVARDNLGQGEILGTQPMHGEFRDVWIECKEVASSGSAPVTVTPLKFRPHEQTHSTAKSPLLQTQSAAFPVPYHSTPVASKLVYGAQSPLCTPIPNVAAKPAKRLDTNVEKSSKTNFGPVASSERGPTLRQQAIASQFKFVSPGVQPRRSLPWCSQIEGPSPNNTFGFKVSQVNLQDAKALHEVQHLTLFSLELHVRTRRDSRPDPEFDPICAIFYYIQTDTPLSNGKNKVKGIICVDEESAKGAATTGPDDKDNTTFNLENVTRRPLSDDAIASTSAGNLTMSTTLQNNVSNQARNLLCRAGVTEYDVKYVAEEKQLFAALLQVIHKWDPDILIGYEVQMLSWGFLLERALTFELDLCTQLSRVKGSSSSSNMDAEKDQWGAAHSSEIKIAGRIILNVWRLMRHEAALNSYSFENVAFHVLHERIPLFSFRTLSDWWDHKNSLNRWRTVDHYVTRCRGNVRILESVDFIGRTSELARLFGIMFYSVISRGSQYRVESMMLRIAKPMNYIPVSPSVEQRGAMWAPETIPLVMEPESRFYSDPVLVLDFQSLYPSMIIAYNYCFSTCLGRVSCLSEYGEFKFGATSLCVPPSLLKKLKGDIHISPNGVAFVKPTVRRGILPSMLDEILQTRIMVKTSMKKWKADKSLGRMLDARQLGLKLIANVTFGYTSAHFSGRMPCVEIGDSIVRKARETLERAIDLVNNTPRWGARVVYGDTDSLFVLLKGATKEQAFSVGKDIVDTVTAMNPKPVKLKFEKVYLPCVLQTKKRYVGYMYETLDQKEPVFDAKGIETVRRDSCPAVAKILEKSLRCLFETRDLSLVKKYVQRQCTKLMEGRASLQDFTFAKEYRGMKNYKPGACVPALELTRRMLKEDRRSEPRVKERVPYVVVYGSPGLPLIRLVRRPYEVLQDPCLRLNASYYITKQILPPLNRVLSLIGLDVFTWYAELPRVVRVAQTSADTDNRKKGTISQYFSTLSCPVCQDLTHSDLCAKCRSKPQESAVTLLTRIRNWERTHQHLAEICYSCCGSRDSKLCCVSLDCPVFYKLVQCTRDVKSSQHLRTILESF